MFPFFTGKKPTENILQMWDKICYNTFIFYTIVQ